MRLKLTTTEAVEKLGFYADYCPKCDSLQRFRADYLTQRHFLNAVIPAARPYSVYVSKCEACEFTTAATQQPAQTLARFSSDRDFQKLAADTNPHLVSDYDATRDAVRARLLQPNGRLLAMSELLREAAAVAQGIGFQHARRDIATVITFLFGVLLPVVIIIARWSHIMAETGLKHSGFVHFLIAGSCAFLLCLLSYPWREKQYHLLPQLSWDFIPYQATKEEVLSARKTVEAAGQTLPVSWTDSHLVASLAIPDESPWWVRN